MEVQSMKASSKLMEVQKVLHMNGGNGETSYAKNSTSQNKVISMAKPIIKKSVLDMYDTSFPETITIADLGCSSGPNTLLAVSEMINIVDQRCRQLDRSSPEFQVFLNDLPGNDFNSVCQSLPAFHEKLREEKGEKFGPCFVAVVPGSFYGRLFPSNTLHFVHSSSSLHWLSRVPPGLDAKANPPWNKGKIYISKTSPPDVAKAYLTQFQRDFSLFLKSRAEEIVAGGRMVLTFLGRITANPSSEESCYLWELLAQALTDLITEGIVEEEKLDSFNAPFYAPSAEEIKSEIEKNGSFELDCLESMALDWSQDQEKDECDKLTKALGLARAIRAVSESMLQNHFGEEVMDRLYQRFGHLLVATVKGVKHINIIVSMIKRNT
ncbi:PREDICTED: jasmonate O-methyltransferase-like [Nelumbo nucifera]|uniref:Jasmonate O-methyltransferase-like n=2 Tax=Nelumbo nucifera TaxID=4432 RepID=A0A1U8AGU5_NELNU|nr:PREDICTED: jasmonate O-methyltransferase-like [Nelumbo nucifera]DAD41654.1 TPA_asm: hypothetical protein HUJ06_015977 [Nelumbo nucifera]